MAEGKQKKKCLGRFETTYMKTMTAPDPSDYEPRTRDYGQFIKVLNNIEMNKKYQFPTGISKYSYDFSGEKYPVIGDKKKPAKPGLKYKPSCPQYAPYHSTTQDMSLIQRRLETEPEHEHMWYRAKTDSIQMKKLGQIKEQLDNLKQLFVEERTKCHDLEAQLERLKGAHRVKKEGTGNKKERNEVTGNKKEKDEGTGSRQNTPGWNERLLKSRDAEKVLTWLTSSDDGGGHHHAGHQHRERHQHHERQHTAPLPERQNTGQHDKQNAGPSDRQKTPRRTWGVTSCGFGPTKEKEKVMQDWIGFQQGEKESIGDYSERFWKLRLEMQGVQSLSNEEQLRRYIAGLRFKFRNEVIALRPNSLSDAIALAEKAEARSPVRSRPPVKTKSKKIPKKASKEPRKKPSVLQIPSPVEQFQYLNLHSSCSCRKEEVPGDRKA